MLARRNALLDLADMFVTKYLKLGSSRNEEFYDMDCLGLSRLY